MKHHDIDTHHNFHDNHDKCDDHDHLERGDSPCQPPLPRSCPLLTSRLNSFLKNYFNFYCYLFVCLTFVCQLLSRHLSIFLDHSITSCVKILKITRRWCNAMFHRNPIQHGVQFLVHTPYVLAPFSFYSKLYTMMYFQWSSGASCTKDAKFREVCTSSMCLAPYISVCPWYILFPVQKYNGQLSGNTAESAWKYNENAMYLQAALCCKNIHT